MSSPAEAATALLLLPFSGDLGGGGQQQQPAAGQKTRGKKVRRKEKKKRTGEGGTELRPR